MQILHKARKISILTVLSLLFITTTSVIVMAEDVVPQPTITLNSAEKFAVLADSAITNTGPTTINGGNIGLHPGSAFTGEEDISKSTGVAIHLADAVALLAKDDLIIAYNQIADLKPTIIPTELEGAILKPGVYASATGTFEITGTLVLDAMGDVNAKFIFLMDSTLVTASESQVVLADGARFCQVYWQVGSSATLGTNSEFVGHVLAMESITATTGAVIQGQLLARNGAVTLDSNTITNGVCEEVTPTPPVATTATLRVIKHVINNDGGVATADNFNIYIKHAITGIAVAEVLVGAEDPGTTYTLPAGQYIVSENGSAAYASSFSGDSDANGKITLAAGDTKTITIINDDIAVEEEEEEDTPTPPIEEEEEVIPTPPIEEEEEVTPTPPIVEEVIDTVDGGKLPYTSMPLYNSLLFGTVLTLIGALGWTIMKKNEQS